MFSASLLLHLRILQVMTLFLILTHIFFLIWSCSFFCVLFFFCLCFFLLAWVFYPPVGPVMVDVPPSDFNAKNHNVINKSKRDLCSLILVLIADLHTYPCTASHSDDTWARNVALDFQKRMAFSVLSTERQVESFSARQSRNTTWWTHSQAHDNTYRITES